MCYNTSINVIHLVINRKIKGGQLQCAVKNYMSKELKKMYKTALSSMNYFFLQIIFRDKVYKNDKQYSNQKNNMIFGIDTHLYDIVKCELRIFLEALAKENLSEEVSILFKEELIIGEYLSGKSLGEIEYLFETGIFEIFGEDYPELLEFYMQLVVTIKK